MTAAQNALILVNRFKGFIYKDGPDEVVHKQPYLAAKQCALICVEEILNSNPIVPLEYMLESEALDKAREYWQSVKTEIEKL